MFGHGPLKGHGPVGAVKTTVSARGKSEEIGKLRTLDLELVCVWVRSASEAAVDAATIAGTAPTGVPATSRIDNVLAPEPNCGLCMPLECNCTGLVAASVGASFARSYITTLHVARERALTGRQ